jgi:hypothetical protein
MKWLWGERGSFVAYISRRALLAGVLLAGGVGCLPSFPSETSTDGGVARDATTPVTLGHPDAATNEEASAIPPGADAATPGADAATPGADAATPPASLGIGASCTSGASCASTFCADGVCCNGACTDSCMQCNLTGLVGACSPVTRGQNPSPTHTACQVAAASTCQEDGHCDGSGHCELWPNATSCGGGSCDPSGNTAVSGSSCDGAGACKPAPTVTCAPFKCESGGTACSTSCAGDGDCVAQPCVNGSCGAVANGSPCTSGSRCASGNCIDGYCCGTCGASCQACDVAGHQGTCQTVAAGQPHGSRPVCSGTGACQGSCDGVDATCAYSGTLMCAAQTCSNGVVSLPSTCNGTGACGTQSTSPCNGFACNGAMCFTTCNGDGQCATATPYCNAGSSTCQATAPPGHACTVGTTTCATGTYCVNGVCCGTSSCTALDSCHVAGTCAAGTGVCSNPTAPDATSCGTNMTCAAGMCVCASGYVSCAGVCTATGSDPNNCGSCNHVCTSVQQCSGGTCKAIPEVLTVNFHGLGGQTASIASSPSGITCSGTTCSTTASYPLGSSVTLTVTQAAGAIIAWSNGCTGTSCAVAINGAMTVNVTTTTKNIVFISSASHSGNFGGITGGPTFCNSLAAAAGIPGHFVAFLATSTTTTFSTLGSARGWIRPDGLPVTDTVSGFQNNQTMFYPPALNELGQMQDQPFFTGTGGTSTCGDWTVTTGLAEGGESPLDEAGRFFGIDGVSCGGAPVMCFGTDLTSQVSVTPVVGRHVFASSGAFTVTSGVAGGDSLCQSAASAAGLANPTHFLALLSTTKASAASRFNLNGATWVRPDGVQVAATPTAFMAGTLMAPVSVNESGAVSGNYAWIGSVAGANSLAASANESCSDWSTASATVNGAIDDPHRGNYDALGNLITVACNTNYGTALYCLEN